ncbi:hypothetical protein [Snodgrassella alvi]|uniref:hypothetical protein n=1 Tax=Snodgrassella alvi TaxID=1196083 RepID=UPI0011872E17|nr:hypothetical protein [Snodgrassella alvi]
MRTELKLIKTLKLRRALSTDLSYTAHVLLQNSGLSSGIFLENWYLHDHALPLLTVRHRASSWQ